MGPVLKKTFLSLEIVIILEIAIILVTTLSVVKGTGKKKNHGDPFGILCLHDEDFFRLHLL